ncbi:hypothetical protein GALMADRAFT_135425 [Galerina marginata CBS 339.88]|uniref:Survival Motor Neuron Gemin2-binding domain-containing protein n=1 Tax=Galerina marginata (strain CBS 339.88) TaxID=685588 RepID=A0A067TQ69_GALM3|nr:hypothetical protein GALMADRAFT_135425 [Galerina marginata CBS 339.88]
MSKRPVVSYDDLHPPYGQGDLNKRTYGHSSPAGEPPPKKLKNSSWSNNPSTTSKSQDVLLPDQPINTSLVSSKAQQQENAHHDDMGDENDFEEESRELTHEEIWDDSALLHAWEAAVEEYEAHHGSETSWKQGPVKKSPLWYNIPVDPSKRSTNESSSNFKDPIPAGPDTAVNEVAEPNSKPIDFNTFVPDYDPSLGPSITPEALPNANHLPGTTAGTLVSQDEAFQRAMSAVYWGGYWTAMYQCQRQLPQSQNRSTSDSPAAAGHLDHDVECEEVLAEREDRIEDDEDDFISTQR